MNPHKRRRFAVSRVAVAVRLAVLGLALAPLAGRAQATPEEGDTQALTCPTNAVEIGVLNVPTESDTASTTKIVVQLPTVGSVSVQPTPGWTVATKTTKLAKPITTDDGPISQTISQVTWTAAAGGIEPGQFQQFFVSLGPLPKAASVSFPAIQYYSDGSVARWIEKAAPGSTAEPEHPAPTLSLSSKATSAAVTRTTFFDCRTLPTSRNATPRARAIDTASSLLSRNLDEDACAITCRLKLRASLARSSSDSPSEK